MRLLSYLRHTPLTGLIFVLLLAAVFGQIWFASTPLPLGGPNVWLAGAAVLLAARCVLWRVGRIEDRSAIIPTLVADFRPVIPVIGVSALLVVWALAVYLFTGTLDATRLGQMVLGIGVLLAVYLAVTGVTRGQLMALAIIFATFVSALFGITTVMIGEPFITTWLHIATPAQENLELILIAGRIAGLTPHTTSLAYQLAVGIPLALAALLYQPAWRGKAFRWTCSATLFVILTAMVTAAVMNASRAPLLGLLAGSLIIVLPSFQMPWARRRLAISIPLLALWLLAFFNPVYDISDLVDTVRDIIREPVIIHTVEGLPAAQQFTVQVRLWDDSAADDADGATVVATTDDDGSLTLVWPQPEGHDVGSLYRFRLKPEGAAQWGPWQDLRLSGECGYVSSRGPRIHGLAAGDVADASAITVGYSIKGLTPDYRYEVQIRASNEHGYGEASTVAGRVADDGRLTLVWRLPRELSSITGYQFRVRHHSASQWRPCRDFIPSLNIPDGAPKGSDRLLGASDASAQSRIPIAIAALRHSLDYPLGSGVYVPNASYVSDELDPVVREYALTRSPHNQFLHVLVLFGFPGLILLILFYVLVLRSLIDSARFIKGAPDGILFCCAAAVTGVMVTYTFVTMFYPVGPFIMGWWHFFIIGLVFSLQRIVTARQASAEPADSPADGVTGGR